MFFSIDLYDNKIVSAAPKKGCGKIMEMVSRVIVQVPHKNQKIVPLHNSCVDIVVTHIVIHSKL